MHNRVNLRTPLPPVVSFFLVGLLLCAQPSKKFDVVSVRPSRPDSDTDTRRLPGGRLIATGLTVKGLIRRAYDVQDFQIVAGPAWTGTNRYDISARAPEGTPPDEPLTPFMQALLADRFGLRIRHETRRLAGLALTRAKGGHKLHVARPDSKTTWTFGRGSATGQNVTTTMLAVNMLQRILGQWVSDETGIAGRFDITLKWNPAEDLNSELVELNPAPGDSVYTAIREQLGLALVARKGPVPVIVIESVSRPLRKLTGSLRSSSVLTRTRINPRAPRSLSPLNLRTHGCQERPGFGSDTNEVCCLSASTFRLVDLP